MYDLKEIAGRVSKGVHVNTNEYLHLLKNNIVALWGFMISNNPGNINNTLRHQLGYIELGFNPNPLAIGKQIEMLYDKNEADEIATIKKSFILNEKGLEPGFINEFNKILR